MHKKKNHSHQLLKDNLDMIRKKILLDVKQYAKEYQKSPPTPKNVPLIFDPGNIEFCERFIAENVDLIDEITSFQILAYKALASWNSGNYSSSLEDFAKVLKFWTENLLSQSVLKSQAGADFVSIFGKMLKTICEHDFLPAVNYLEIVLQDIDNNTPIVPYLMLIHFRNYQKFPEVCVKLELDHPFVSFLSEKDFEATLLSSTNDREIEECAQKFLKQIGMHQGDFQITKSGIELTPEMSQKMFDVELLQFLSDDQFDSAIKLICKESQNGLVPSMDVIQVVTQAKSSKHRFDSILTL